MCNFWSATYLIIGIKSGMILFSTGGVKEGFQCTAVTAHMW